MIDYRLQNEEPTDEEILSRAYHNAWLLFSGKKTFTQISISSGIQESYMPFDPYDIMDLTKFLSTIDNMLAWYIETEEYEKCAFLRDFTYEEYIDIMKPFDMEGTMKFRSNEK